MASARATESESAPKSSTSGMRCGGLNGCAVTRRPGLCMPTARSDQVSAEVHAALDSVLDEVRATPVDELLEGRKVGRAGLPSTKLGLLFHIAEHATRHAGQALTTARILGGQVG